MLVARLSECYSPFSLLEAIFVLVIWYQQQVLKNQNCWLQNWFCHRRRGSVLQNPKTAKSSFSNLIGFKVSEIVSLSSWKQQQKNLFKNEVDWKTEADLQTARWRWNRGSYQRARAIGCQGGLLNNILVIVTFSWKLSYVLRRYQCYFLNSKNLHLRPML